MKIIEPLNDTLKECNKVLPGGVIDIFVFPTFSRFVKEEMFGVSGFTPWKDTVSISVHVDVLSYGRPLIETLSHEIVVEMIAENRGLDIEDVRAVSDGKILLGDKALEYGLIDRIGGLHDALEDMGRGIEDACELYYFY